MPTYDYECDACNYKFELYQSISAPVETKCPRCNKKKLRRLIGTGAAIVFKGSGFYQTDYRSESYKKAASSDKTSTNAVSSDSAGTSTSGAKSESSSSSSSGSSSSSSSTSSASSSSSEKTGKKPKTSR